MGWARLDQTDLCVTGLFGLQSAGKLKLVPGGIGWREAATGTVTTLKADDFKKWTWLRAARDYQLKIALKNGTFYKFDGFPREVSR